MPIIIALVVQPYVMAHYFHFKFNVREFRFKDLTKTSIQQNIYWFPMNFYSTKHIMVPYELLFNKTYIGSL